MSKTLTRHGNSLALVIDKPILELLHIDEHTKLEIATDGARLIIMPANKASHSDKVDQLIRESHRKYAGVYRALSKPE